MVLIAKVVLRGVTQEQYDAVRDACGWLERPPAGGLGHLTWWEEEDCVNTDAWESEAAFTAFAEQRLGPAMAAAGVTAQPEISFSPAHEVFTPYEQRITATPAAGGGGTSNVDVIRGVYASFTAGDIPGVLARLDDSVVWSVPETMPGGGRYVGPSGVAEFFAGLGDVFAALQVEPTVFLDSADTVVVLGTHHAIGKNGTSLDLPWVHVWSLANGRITSLTEHFDTMRLRSAMSGAEATLRRMFDEIVNEGRLDVADELFAPDYVDHGPMGDLVGIEAFKQVVATWRSAVPDVHCEVENVIADGDRVAWLVRTTGTHTGDGLGFPATGRSFETVTSNLGTFRDGKAAEHWSEQGMFPMLVQLGVLPTPAAQPAPA